MTKKAIPIFSENERIEKVIVQSSVDHIDLNEPLGGTHIHEAIQHNEVTPLDDLDSHFPSEKGVLEIGAVIDSRC